jgi:hypothetical protein
VRQRFEERFTAARMARDYVAIYERLAGAGGRREDGIGASGHAAKTNGNGALNAR